MNDIVIETLDSTEVHTPVAVVESPQTAPTFITDEKGDVFLGYVQEAPEGEAVV